MSKVISPSLSTIDQPSYEMGVTSFEVLLDAIQKKNKNQVFLPITKTLPTQLIIRQSTQP
jgi:LacI family transcriptional regulator